MNALEAALSLQDINALMIYNLHKLSGNRKGLFALDIDGRASSYRLIIQPLDEAEAPTIDSGNNLVSFYRSIKIIRIEEVSKHYE